MRRYATDPVPAAEQEEPKITDRQRDFLLKLLEEKVIEILVSQLVY